MAQGVTGIMSVTGEPGRPPVKAGLPITDLGAGLFALAGILAALHYRDRTGLGQYIDTSLMEAGLALSVWEAAEYFGGRGVPGPLGSAHRMSAPYQAFRCADGFITVGAANQRTFEKLAALLGHAEWVTDPRFASDDARVRASRGAGRGHRRGDGGRARARSGSSGSTPRAFRAGRSSTTPKRSTAPQAQAREMTVTVDHPALGRVRTIGTPLKLSRDAARLRAAGRHGSASTPTRCCASSAIRRREVARAARRRRRALTDADTSPRPVGHHRGMQSLLGTVLARISTRCCASSPGCSSRSTACRSSSAGSAAPRCR